MSAVDTNPTTTDTSTGWQDDDDDQQQQHTPSATAAGTQPWKEGDDISMYDPDITALLNRVHTSQAQLTDRRQQLHGDINAYKLEVSKVKGETSELVAKMEKSFVQIEKLI